MKQSSRVIILVKALPQPSKTYGETVCCAGVTFEREWKRLFPIRFRHLSGDARFRRWNIVEFEFDQPKRDNRRESCHVFEDSLRVVGSVKPAERSALLSPMFSGSAKSAASNGDSLTLIRPKTTKFIYKKRTSDQIEAQKTAFRRAARQLSFLDSELQELEPSPYDFRFRFEDDSGRHDYACGDWEVHAMFYKERRRTNEASALMWLNETFNERYPKLGMAFALGNMASRPQTWQLLGVLRLDDAPQTELLL